MTNAFIVSAARRIILNPVEILNWAQQVKSLKLHQLEASFSFQSYIKAFIFKLYFVKKKLYWILIQTYAYPYIFINMKNLKEKFKNINMISNHWSLPHHSNLTAFGQKSQWYSLPSRGIIYDIMSMRACTVCVPLCMDMFFIFILQSQPFVWVCIFSGLSDFCMVPPPPPPPPPQKKIWFLWPGQIDPQYTFYFFVIKCDNSI